MASARGEKTAKVTQQEKKNFEDKNPIKPDVRWSVWLVSGIVCSKIFLSQTAGESSFSSGNVCALSFV